MKELELDDVLKNAGLKLLFDRMDMAPEEFLDGSWDWVERWAHFFSDEQWEVFNKKWLSVKQEAFTRRVVKQIMNSGVPQQLEIEF